MLPTSIASSMRVSLGRSVPPRGLGRQWGSQGAEVGSDVEDGGGVGEGADGDVVDAGGADGGGVGEGEAAGGLEQRTRRGRVRGVLASAMPTARRIWSGVKLSSSTRSAPASSTSVSWPSESTSTSTGEPGPHRADRLERRRHSPGGDDVVVLHERGVRQRHAVVDAAAAAHGVLLEHPQARRGLAGVAHLGAGALERVGPLRGRGRDAGEVAEQVERGALGGEQVARAARAR